MKQKMPAYAVLLMVALAFWAACTKPSPFGSDLLSDDLADYAFTDTVTVWCTVELEDSVLTSDPSSTASSFLCGELADPAFGKTNAEIFTLLHMDFPEPGFDSLKHQYDSIVLYMRYAPSSVYGDTLQPQTLRVYRLDELLDDENSYYSNSTLNAGAEIGRLESFLPKPNTPDSLIVTTSKAPYVRIPLSDDFGKELFRLDTTTLETDTSFYKALRGLKIVASSGGASPGAMLAFNLNDEAYSRVRLYYHDIADTTLRHFDFFFAGSNKFVHFDHDYSGTPAGQVIGQMSDDLMYLQPMQGLRIKVEFPYIDKFDNIAVNKAQLVLTNADNNSVLTPANQLVFTEVRGDTTAVFTSDVLYAIGPALNQGFSRFGGNPEMENVNGTLVERYRLTLTQRLQDMVDDTSGELKKKTVYINVTPQSRVAQRSVLYGPGSAAFPAKLELKYTRVQ
jgi:hypothetical protein